MNIIEQFLQVNSLNTEQSILQGQWEFDKKNIPNALKAIAVVFPHYSLHDESHSLSILNNIVKMLGEEIVGKLSCTDLWLLLEAAYCHDLGMVVTAERLDRVLHEDDFLKHFLKISVDENHPLNRYSKCFHVKEGKLYYNETEFQVDKFDSSRYLLADFFRNKHAENSKKTVAHPFDEAGIDSPRSIIPARLFGMLSDICRAHTQDFDKVMALPKNEDGIGLDECHPRFIACMLRLGDLLDIDNNRFSVTLIRTIKELPSESKAHLEKHKAISHLSINTKCIEIEAICHSPKVAQVTQDWFDWISDEFKTQTLKWNSIVPDSLDCYLPTLNYLRTKIEGYETVSGKKDTKFTIDTSKALELLQGKNFYNDAFDSIREIIQNGVDSTLLRIFHEANKKGIIFNSLDSAFLDFAQDYPINISIIEDKGKYTIEICDHGMGMKRDQLTYLINTGSSSKNIDKKLMIERMPEWMRPSGVFGIGFQSVFLLTDKVEILTKHSLNDEKMAIEMYSPNSQMKGDVYLKKVEGTCEPGLTIRFEVNQEVSIQVNDDPFNALPRDFRRSQIEHKIREYAKRSVIPIIIKHQNGTDKDEQIERLLFNYYDEETCIELGFSKESFELDKSSGGVYYYRNAVVSGDSSIMFLNPMVNVHFGSAKDLLTLDRGSFKDGKLIKEKAISAIVNFMNSDHFSDFLDKMGENKINASNLFSFFIEFYNKKDDIKDHQILADIKKFKLQALGYTKTIEEIVNADKLKFRTSSKQIIAIREKEGILTVESNMVPIITPNFLIEIIRLLFKMASDLHSHCYCTERISENIFGGAEYYFCNDEIVPVIKLSMLDVKANFESAASRSYINYLSGYEDIRVPSDSINSNISNLLLSQPLNDARMEKIISPFIRMNDHVYDCRNEELYKYVSNLTGKDSTMVKAAYDRFVSAAINAGLKLG